MNIINFNCMDCNEILAQVKSPVMNKLESKVLCVSCAKKRKEQRQVNTNEES